MPHSITTHYFIKSFKCAAIALLMFFICTPVSADGNHLYTVRENSELNKKQSDRRFFLLAVIDSDDKEIGERCVEDLATITFAFKEVADWLEIDWNEPKIIQGSEFGKAAVNDAIDNWLQRQEPGSDDIIVFYYSGHGFRLPTDTDDYPRMWLKTASDQNIETTNLKMQDVYNRIVKLGGGINLVISDCCNTTSAGESGNFDSATIQVRERITHKKPDNDNDDLDNGEKLFNPQHPFSLLATAAGKGEFAGGKSDVGGFFTYYLVEALEKCIYDESITAEWQNIFKYADDNASYWARSAACPDAKQFLQPV